MTLRGILHFARILARPVLKLLGVKPGTVASDAAPVLDAIDDTLPPEKPPPKKTT